MRQTIASFGHNVDTNVDRLTVDNLTVGGSDLGQALAAMEPAFVVEAPLEKDYNFSTGVTTLRVDTTGLGPENPHWVAGKVDGNTSVLVSKGRVGFSVVQTAAGNFRVDFASPHPNGAHYVIQLTATAANYWVDGGTITASSFLVALRTSSSSAANVPFFFSVLA